MIIKITKIDGAIQYRRVERWYENRWHIVRTSYKNGLIVRIFEGVYPENAAIPVIALPRINA